jgi:hypothetical protein
MHLDVRIISFPVYLFIIPSFPLSPFPIPLFPPFPLRGKGEWGMGKKKIWLGTLKKKKINKKEHSLIGKT